MCVEHNIPCSSDFSLTTTLGQQVYIATPRHLLPACVVYHTYERFHNDSFIGGCYRSKFVNGTLLGYQLILSLWRMASSSGNSHTNTQFVHYKLHIYCITLQSLDPFTLVRVSLITKTSNDHGKGVACWK